MEGYEHHEGGLDKVFGDLCGESFTLPAQRRCWAGSFNGLNIGKSIIKKIKIEVNFIYF